MMIIIIMFMILIISCLKVLKDAQRIAAAKAKMYGWDKPDFWPRVMATRAAEP
jgi:hypothetical protein